MTRLQGKRALITGGTSGIGLETARSFLAEGARIIVTGSTQHSADTAAATLGGDVVAVGADALDLDAQRSLADTVRDHFGELDVAFLNAGVSDWRPFEQHDEESFDRLFDINVKSVFFLMQALVPVLARPASVIVNASNSAHGGGQNANAYAATKAAVASLVRSWNADLFVARGVRFNAVSPGPIATPLYDKAPIPADYRNEVMEAIRKGIPAGRFGDPREVAAAVTFLASDESGFVVGHDLVIDGGQTTLY
ncbi:SDR family oxidoreductase [Rhodococcus erythropolis]|uniref:SDR family oxidoreductase n=1 Tax=Rhodococcus erythropolis TaxID=1833 RepID=UPI0029495171|nr:SDR family oxidoreductase [Rhodococcus erythropolis]MDV6212715.1 SDR family oxidoreductase [Rhodococcus erythropolis]